MRVNKYLRRRCLLAVATLLCPVGAIEWSSSTSSSSDFIHTAAVGDLLTIVIEPGDRANIDFTGPQSNHFAVSYRQCSEEVAQPLQIQYAGKLNYVAFPGGCIYVENELAGIGEDGCTFWQYNPGETYQMSGNTHEDSEPLDPGRVRFENQGSANATVEVAMFSSEVPKPAALVDHNDWIEDGFSKKDNVINTTVNVYLNREGNYCDEYGCTVSGYVNNYVEGQESLTVCQVLATGTVVHNNLPFKTSYIPLTFELPEDDDYYVTLILNAKENNKGAANMTELQEWGLDKVMVFQTDTTQKDNSARVLAGLSLVTLTWLILFNTLFATLGSARAQELQQPIPALGW